jgi:glycosyltransferase involved in cell wall biosynthesis
MKIVIIAAMFPPAGLGGAEDCARSFAQWAATNGHEVAVVMAAADRHAAPVFHDGKIVVHQVQTEHVYPVARRRDEAKWKKPVWYLQDHVDGRTAAKVAAIASGERPDVVMVHYLQGFGYRTISALARLEVPIAMVLHDLGLVCWRMGMFRGDTACGSPCASCKLSTSWKRRLFERAANHAPIGLISPSHANLAMIGRYFPIERFPHATILNTKTYPIAQHEPSDGSTLRLLYAGKLDPAKGIDRLMQAVATLPPHVRVTLDVAGSGSLRDSLRLRHTDEPRITFLGFVSQEELAQAMARSNLLCVPSVWPENSPGVVVQAILNGLPVVATGNGGLPELVRDGIDGRILPDDSVAAWSNALLDLASRPDAVNAWRERLADVQPRFAIDAIGEQTVTFLASLRR